MDIRSICAQVFYDYRANLIDKAEMDKLIKQIEDYEASTIQRNLFPEIELDEQLAQEVAA